jgi:hypothetical protein
MDGRWVLETYVDILGHFTHGKAHVSIEICNILVQESDDVLYRHLSNPSNTGSGENKCHN